MRKRRKNALDKFRKVGVFSRRGENLKSLLARFKKTCDKANIMKDVKRHLEYEKPSDRKKREEHSRQKAIKKYHKQKK